MAVVMATTCTLATTISKAVHAVVTHTPPPTGSLVNADNTIKNTNRTQSATQSFMLNNTHQGR